MKILFRKKFKKLREAYKDLGETKLLIIEDMAERNYTYSTMLSGIKIRYPNDENATFDDARISRSAEYFVKYRALIKARSKARDAIAAGAVIGGTTLFFKKCYDAAKTNRTLDEEYKRGRDEAYDNIESYCASRNGEDSWIGDTSDGKHMILRISDEETDDYKEFNGIVDEE